jgi:deazaflavin-dependent oxidoreductase (nitroreductase family)
MDLAHAHASPSHVEVSWRPFVRHLVEMIVAMLLGMAVLGAAVSLFFALIGHSNVLHYAGLRGLLMSGYMTVGMALWMRHRGHGWLSVGEMAAAMFVPYAALIGPFAAGSIPAGQFLGVMHVLMLPCMVAVMLHHREEYSRDHRLHASRSARALPRGLARFNRRVANPIVRLVAGRVPPLAVIHHTGRSSGRIYRTPVLAFVRNDVLVITLVYGAGSDWVRNVDAAGGASITRLGRSEAYVEPEISRGQEARGWVPPVVRLGVRLLDFDLMRMKRSPAPHREDGGPSATEYGRRYRGRPSDLSHISASAAAIDRSEER